MIRKWNIILHRDLGYFFTALTVAYCLSGLALNHVDDWNPDFIIHRDSISVPGAFIGLPLSDSLVLALSCQVGEETYKVYDTPHSGQLKIYYNDASLHVNFTEGRGLYERVSRRPVIYETNVLHRNSLKGWKWASDVFALMLIAITLTGLFVLKGKYGLGGRGKWLVLAGFLPPILALIIFEIK